MIERLGKTKDPTKRRELLLSLGSNLNNLATSELREILANPFSPDKEEAIKSLGEKPRKDLEDDLIRVAEDDDSYVQLDAIAALGSYKGEKSRATLEQLLEGRWSSVRSMIAEHDDIGFIQYTSITQCIDKHSELFFNKSDTFVSFTVEHSILVSSSIHGLIDFSSACRCR